MSYKPIFTRSFTREFDKLPRNAKERILEALEKVAETPYTGTKLRGKLGGLWRWRIGKYRYNLFNRRKRESCSLLRRRIKKNDLRINYQKAKNLNEVVNLFWPPILNYTFIRVPSDREYYSKFIRLRSLVFFFGDRPPLVL